MAEGDHGRSRQVSSGNDMNGYAEDLAVVIDALISGCLIGGLLHRSWRSRALHRGPRPETGRQAVVMAALPLVMLRSAANPEWLRTEMFDNLPTPSRRAARHSTGGLAISFCGAKSQRPRSPEAN